MRMITTLIVELISDDEMQVSAVSDIISNSDAEDGGGDAMRAAGISLLRELALRRYVPDGGHAPQALAKLVQGLSRVPRTTEGAVDAEMVVVARHASTMETVSLIYALSNGDKAIKVCSDLTTTQSAVLKRWSRLDSTSI